LRKGSSSQWTSGTKKKDGQMVFGFVQKGHKGGGVRGKERKKKQDWSI